MTKFNDLLKDVNPKVAHGIRMINLSLVEFLSTKKTTTLSKIEKHMGTRTVSLDLTANLLKTMISDGIIKMDGKKVIVNDYGIKLFLQQNTIVMPKRHRKLWIDDDYITLAELFIETKSIEEIARKMGRTEQSIITQSLILKKATQLIGMIKTNDVIMKFAESRMPIRSR